MPIEGISIGIWQSAIAGADLLPPPDIIEEMTTGHLGWGEVFMRLGLAAVAGTAIGINRGQRGRAAGLRTMFLVCTGSALAMIAAHWLYIDGGSSAGGDNSTSRWAQGILAGMGFLGAGAILRKGNLIRGVTTAASLWYVTILGLSFGAGCWQIGLVAWGFALFALFVLPHIEWHLMEDRYSTVTIVTRPDAITESEFCAKLEAMGLCVERLGIDYQVSDKLKRIRCDVRYHVGRQFDVPQQVIAELSHRAGVAEVCWK